MNELSLFSESMNGAQSTDMEQSVKALSSSNNLNNVEVSCDEVDEIDLADFKHDYRTGEPALYVGTYAKYNNGDLSGMWISIARCYDYEEFMKVCYFKAYAELDEDEQRAYEAFLDLRCESDLTVEDFRENYCGEWNSEEEFAENLIEELGILDEVPEHLRRFFDVSAYSDELFRYDYDYTDGFVFRTT